MATQRTADVTTLNTDSNDDSNNDSSNDLNKGIQIPEHIASLTPYKSGKPIAELAREKGLKRIVKLASNENPLGCSPLALEAMESNLSDASRYVDPDAFELTSALSAYHNRPRNEIICGAGTDSLLAYIICAFSSEGDELLTAEATFIGIFVNAHKYNRKIVTTPLYDNGFDLKAIAKAITSSTKIIYLANPNNPTGTMFEQAELDEFLSKVPSRVLVILDEAYFNYACNDDNHPDGLNYNQDNVIITRTFSKDYGLAGLRVGYAIGPEKLIHELYKVKLPFEPAHTAQSAAVAALGDTEFLEKTLELNRRSMKQLRDGFDTLGIKYAPSHTNFLLLLFDSEEQAASLAAECMDRGLILRHTKLFGAPCGVRINSGTVEEGEFALQVIAEVWSQIQAS